ncbi:transglutaminase-like domain-containing protein [Phosphitispora sp. TUW77]|uniref:transglutaminase-like domain-containing protein n=1 Tax=Phosphitispora sp. TUW77 TaxID=3152361 RepID=UPI003AB74F4F
MKDIRLLKRILIILIASFLLTIFAPDAFAGEADIRWFSPYTEGNSVTLTGDSFNTWFTFQGTVTEKYTGIIVRAVFGKDQVYYYYPAVDNTVLGTVYMRFGYGTYRVDFNLVKPSSPGVIDYDSLARVWIENTGNSDLRYLLPSWGIESNNPLITQKAQQIVGQAWDDFSKTKAIFQWVSQNMVYDMDKFRRGEFYDNDGAVKALQTQKGLCRDYANLVTAMCRAEGLEARTVIGEAGIGTAKYGHAWNEVRIGDRWVSMDAVWKVFDQDAEIFGNTHKKIQEVY